jgi:hypothetical protein
MFFLEERLEKGRELICKGACIDLVSRGESVELKKPLVAVVDNYNIL